LMRTFRADGTTGGVIQTSPDSSLMRTYRADGTAGGVIQVDPTASLMSTYREDGTDGGLIRTSPTLSTMRTYSGNSSEAGWVRVQPQNAELAYVDPNNVYFSRIRATDKEAFIYTRAGGSNRYLTVDADGIWVKTNKGGSWKWYNLEETAQDSGWVNLSSASGFGSAGSGGPFQIRRAGDIVHLRGRLGRTIGTIVADKQYTIGTLYTTWRPAYTQRTLIAGGSSSQWGRIEVSAITGEIS